VSRRPSLASAVFLALAGAMLLGCDGPGAFGGPGPFVREGNAESVEIGFIGDVANAMPVARKHCARFDRVPRYVQPTLDGGLFECVRAGS
jgi:hypothetical protein